MAEIGLGLAEPARASRRAAPKIVSSEARAAILGLGEATAIAGEWADLAARAVEDNQFFHPDVALPAAACLRTGVRLAVVRSADGRLIAAAPVTGDRLGRIAPATRVWSHDYGPLGVPLIDPAATDAAVAAFVEQIAPAGGSLVIPDLPLGSPIAAAFQRMAMLAGRPVDVVHPYRRAMLRRSAGDLRATLAARRRKEFARQMRRLADLGEVVVESVAEPARVRARFEEFLVLEAAGWKGRKHSALVSSEGTLSFARAMVRARAESGHARIDSIRLNRRPIAMLVSFVAGSTAWTWKIAYAEDFARFSPGAQLMLEAPRHLFADGKVERIDSLASADHPMIDHLWPDRLAIGTLVIGPKPGSLRATALHRIGLAAFRAEATARALAHRLRARLKARRSDKEKEA
jgi:CelD/BcsL family acetyltransferase involved in cellulose biosynthesis